MGRWNPRAEAEERLEDRFAARVLEPSPPALEGNRDDPPARGEVPAGRRLVSPVSDGDVLWNTLAGEDQALAEWCADRWLGAWRRLAPVPAGLAETRMALHEVAERVVSPARLAATGNEISLRYTRGGFGTPFFGADAQVRVEGAELVVQEGEDARRAPLTTLRDAARTVGLAGAAELDDAPLAIDEGAARFLGDWFGFATLVIAELRARADAALDPSGINLWPEHFDIAAELGSEEAGKRASYGGSPADEHHPEPYLYVAPWAAEPTGDLWNATGFTGAELGYAELLAADDQVTTAVEFLTTRLRALTG